MQHKAQRFLRLGPDLYRRGDVFGKPDVALTGCELAIVRLGMEQLARRTGFRRDDPLTGLGGSGIYQVMDTLHHRLHDRITHADDDATGLFHLDEMRFQHVVSRSLVTVFNRVPG